MAVEIVPVKKLKMDAGTQQREAIVPGVVEDYAEKIKGGAKFPHPVAFCDNKGNYFVADGFHTILAQQMNGVEQVKVDVRQGTKRDAIWFSISANSKHGLNRTVADKERAVRTALNDREWAKFSDNEIAAHAGVHHNFVAKIRSKIVAEIEAAKNAPPADDGAEDGSLPSKDDVAPAKRVVNRGGKTYEMNVANIGSKGKGKKSSGEENGKDDDASPPPAEPVPETDTNGRTIPEAARAAFAGRHEYKALENAIAQIIRQAKTLGESASGAFLPVQAVTDLLTNAKSTIRHAEPYCVCPYCGGKGCKPKAGDRNNPCQGKGWITKDIFDAAPPEVRG